MCDSRMKVADMGRGCQAGSEAVSAGLPARAALRSLRWLSLAVICDRPSHRSCGRGGTPQPARESHHPNQAADPSRHQGTVGKGLADHTLEDAGHLVSRVQFPDVVATGELGDIPVKVLFAHPMECAVKCPLE